MSVCMHVFVTRGNGNASKKPSVRLLDTYHDPPCYIVAGENKGDPSSHQERFVAMASTGEPVLSRLDRLDHPVGNLEEMKGIRSGKSSSVSTPRSGTTMSDGNPSESSSPASLEGRCRPLNEVLVEARLKGSIVDRLDYLENRVVKLEEVMKSESECMKMMDGGSWKEEVGAGRRKEEGAESEAFGQELYEEETQDARLRKF